MELINIFCIFGPPSILQADNGKEFSHSTKNSRLGRKGKSTVHRKKVIITPHQSNPYLSLQK
jgi:hypothetical protein